VRPGAEGTSAAALWRPASVGSHGEWSMKARLMALPCIALTNHLDGTNVHCGAGRMQSRRSAGAGACEHRFIAKKPKAQGSLVDGTFRSVVTTTANRRTVQLSIAPSAIGSALRHARDRRRPSDSMQRAAVITSTVAPPARGHRTLIFRKLKRREGRHLGLVVSSSHGPRRAGTFVSATGSRGDTSIEGENYRGLFAADAHYTGPRHGAGSLLDRARPHRHNERRNHPHAQLCLRRLNRL